jgi:hypothetical protein
MCVELVVRLLRLAGAGAEAKKKDGGKRDVWRVYAYIDKLAAGRKELRDSIGEIVRRAVESVWVDAGKAERWLKKLKSRRVSKVAEVRSGTDRGHACGKISLHRPRQHSAGGTTA